MRARTVKFSVPDKTYGECKRSGLRFPVKDLVKDGQMRGLLVHRDERDPKHPQELPLRTRAERHDVVAPEISRAGDEGDAAPVLAFDESGKLI